MDQIEKQFYLQMMVELLFGEVGTSSFRGPNNLILMTCPVKPMIEILQTTD
jgi:hypothetical protein